MDLWRDFNLAELLHIKPPQCTATVEVSYGGYVEYPEFFQCDLPQDHEPKRHRAEDRDVWGGKGNSNVVVTVEWDSE